MAASIPYEISKFRNHARQLRRILRDTKQSLEDIEKSGYFTEEQIESIQLKLESEQTVYGVIYSSIGITILGHDCWAKAAVANELFGQKILPTEPQDAESDSSKMAWRMVRFIYGVETQVSLALPNSYELLDHLVSHEQQWHTVPLEDLELKGKPGEDPAFETAVLDVKLRHQLLRDDVVVMVSPTNVNASFEQILSVCMDGFTSIVIYAISNGVLSQSEVSELMEIKKKFPKLPIFFICVFPPSSELTESEQHVRNIGLYGRRSVFKPHSYHESSPMLQTVLKRKESLDSKLGSASLTLCQQLCGLGFLNVFSPNLKKKLCRQPSGGIEVESKLIEDFENFSSILLHIRQILQAELVQVATILNEAHNTCLRMFILSAFDMTWDMLITPKRIAYARQRENELYESLMSIANCKQEEIRQLIVETINGMTDELLVKASDYEFQGVELSENEPPSVRELQICTSEIQSLVLHSLNSAVAGKLIGSVDYLRESFVGTLERCLVSLENVKEGGEPSQASNALKQILNAAYQVEVTVRTSSSLLRVLFEKMKQLVQTLPWKAPPVIDSEWKRKVAYDMLMSLSESRLARSICSQFRERLRASHEQFAASLRHLEAMHSGRLERTEEQRLKVRKLHAPKLAKFALESTSLRDIILYGMPHIGREIGRGQYGVVYACDSWAGYSPCAIKSVVPPDDKHWNDLAMEFYYTRSIPEHDRIVQIRGSVIDLTYAGGSTPAVLLVMDRLQRDLYSALKMGLPWKTRLQIALDVVQGIRFLHGQGLVHRDIKLKNVLLDKHNRAKITDLGFCKPEAMMSGSIVGTPIHMAPELFSGRYDNSVDVYAFGILFWYICADHVRLPYVYEQCQSKDQLWTSVKKGARPERLPQFDENCWRLMEDCWNGNPSLRPLLGEVEPRLMEIIEYYEHNPLPSGFSSILKSNTVNRRNKRYAKSNVNTSRRRTATHPQA
ncbi:dual serine/threonine and tyrosine protein kinase-like isoform X3 [Argiope bruennichi]|uniref:dual serine/threonine and tyrosine protein kinase-like isoform X3 n=1 Tax=Argiope bruennichi TaxID=94029 RepID=UPI002493E6F0|nr:dual serine/threonine and tyrosine protein kinase-like isoform X3 [Argiope bruennichi]